VRFDNGYGDFNEAADAYVIRIRPERGGDLAHPPRPWINVIANERFGSLVSEAGSCSSWSGNSREHRLTPWFNDPVLDPHGEAFYIRDEESGSFWSPLPGPVATSEGCEVRHSFGWSSFRRERDGLLEETTFFVPPKDPLRIVRIKITNREDRARRLSLFSYAWLVLGLTPEESGRFVVTEIDEPHDALLARSRIVEEFADCVAFAAVVAPDARGPSHFTCDRESFIGRQGSPARPAALLHTRVLDGAHGAGPSPCFAQQVRVLVPPDHSIVVSFLLGEGKDEGEAHSLIRRYRTPEAIDRALEDARSFWRKALGGIRVTTPDPALDVMVNGWLAYQTLGCRILARTAFYQSGGAFGFRDQIQDAAALIYLQPERTRDQILLHASHQFLEGDVLHWWHPPLSRGIRTRFVDDLLWLPHLTAFYVTVTGDRGVLGEVVRFIDAAPLRDDEDEALVVPDESGIATDLYDHCCRALDRSLATGAHGLPLFGTGDWNDGMNRVGREGKGESVWMGFFLASVLKDFLPICEERGDAERAARYHEALEGLRDSVNGAGWDGEWYRRGYYDNGEPLGSRRSDECKIDALVQAWAVISGMAPPERAAQAIDAVERHLISEEDGIIRLLTPPFENTPNDPGYIKGYVPGVRENGGQYTHAALWVIRAVAELSRNNRAAQLLRMINPITRTRTENEVAVYQLEPYVVAADVYGEPPHVGRGGWSWYTGSAGWMYRVAIESILGFRLIGGDTIQMKPCIPDDWPGYTFSYQVPGEATRYEIRVDNRHGRAAAPVASSVDGAPGRIEHGIAWIPLSRDGQVHHVEIVLGAREES
jgi:cyclic beta-1,2-glucan synthetase